MKRPKRRTNRCSGHLRLPNQGFPSSPCYPIHKGRPDHCGPELIAALGWEGSRVLKGVPGLHWKHSLYVWQEPEKSIFKWKVNGGIITTPSFPSRIGASTMGWAGDAGCTPRPPIRPRRASERRVIIVIFLGLLLDLLAFTLLLPLLPGLLESHGREQVSPSPKAGALPLPSLSQIYPAGLAFLVTQDPLYGSWQRGVDWFATAIGMPAEKRYNSVLFGGMSLCAMLGPHSLFLES